MSLVPNLITTTFGLTCFAFVVMNSVPSLLAFNRLDVFYAKII